MSIEECPREERRAGGRAGGMERVSERVHEDDRQAEEAVCVRGGGFNLSPRLLPCVCVRGGVLFNTSPFPSPVSPHAPPHHQHL
jgi:hypothetical protein